MGGRVSQARCPAAGHTEMRCPPRAAARPSLARAGVARFAQRYPALLDALLRSVLELVCKYHKTGGFW
jgi:hypothetical protein